MFEEALRENLLDHEDVAGILQQKFIARNTNKSTTLKELKPYFYERLFRLKEKYKRRDGNVADTYKKMISNQVLIKSKRILKGIPKEI